LSYSEKLEEIQRRRAELRTLERQAEAEAKAMRPLTEADEHQMRDMQSRADEAYRAANRRAPPPHAYERPDSYERRLIEGIASHSPTWARADFSKMPDNAFAVAASQVLAEAVKSGPTAGLKPGEIREMPSESHGGHKVIEFRGGENSSFIKHFTRPARRAVFADHAAYAAMSRDAQLSRITELARYGQRPIVQAPTPRF
jgi:hypothetical protein